jgi:uncharacterized protein (TIGR02118 family)
VICVSVFYPSGAGKTFDHEYYEKKHRPLAMDLLVNEITRYDIDQGLSGLGPGSEPM